MDVGGNSCRREEMTTGGKENREGKRKREWKDQN